MRIDAAHIRGEEHIRGQNSVFAGNRPMDKIIHDVLMQISRRKIINFAHEGRSRF